MRPTTTGSHFRPFGSLSRLAITGMIVAGFLAPQCDAQTGQFNPGVGSGQPPAVQPVQASPTTQNPPPFRPSMGSTAGQAQPPSALPSNNPPQNPSTGQSLPTSSPPSTSPPSSASFSSPASPNQAATNANPVAGGSPPNGSANQNPPETERRSITRVTKSMTKLPNDAGQVWREYDITPYTSRITGINDPQQAILDWILKETGTEMWFNQPLGILSADRNQLSVYHTPEIHQVVNRIVDRFVNTRGQMQDVEISLITIGKPNWRSSAYAVLQPIEVQTPGVEAWMISKENAALLRSSLARRGDFRDHGTGKISHNDGQTVVLQKTKPVQFIRNFRWVPNQTPAYQPLVTKIDEGYTLKISSLSSIDGKTIEAAIECRVDQVEKFNTVNVEVPAAPGGSTNRIGLQIPQLVSWRMKERFRWPNDQVLLLSCGVVAIPEAQASLPINLPFNLPDAFSLNRTRADALLFVDYRGPQLANNVPTNPIDLRTVPVSDRR